MSLPPNRPTVAVNDLQIRNNNEDFTLDKNKKKRKRHSTGISRDTSGQVAGFVCNMGGCKREYKTLFGLNYHKGSHMSSTDRKRFLCPNLGCSRGYYARGDLNRHMRKKHNVDDPQACPQDVNKHLQEDDFSRNMSISMKQDIHDQLRQFSRNGIMTGVLGGREYDFGSRGFETKPGGYTGSQDSSGVDGSGSTVTPSPPGSSADVQLINGKDVDGDARSGSGSSRVSGESLDSVTVPQDGSTKQHFILSPQTGTADLIVLLVLRSMGLFDFTDQGLSVDDIVTVLQSIPPTFKEHWVGVISEMSSGSVSI